MTSLLRKISGMPLACAGSNPAVGATFAFAALANILIILYNNIIIKFK